MTSVLTTEQRLEICNKLSEESDSDLTPDQITEATTLRDDLDMDSIGSVSLMIELEEYLDIALEGDEMAEIETVGDLYHLIDNKLTEEGLDAATVA